MRNTVDIGKNEKETLTDTITINNLGNGTAVINYVLSDLELTSVNPISDAPKIISTSKLSITDHIIKQEDTNHKLTLSVDIESDKTATYEGKILFYGGRF